MANCASIDPLVTPYLDGELPSADRSVIDDHLRRCPPCRSRVEAERVVRGLVHAKRSSFEGVRASDALRERCASLARASSAAIPARKAVAADGRRSWRMRMMPVALAASLVVLVGGAFLYQAADGSARVLAAELAADHVKCFALDGVLGTKETPAAVESAML